MRRTCTLALLAVAIAACGSLPMRRGPDQGAELLRAEGSPPEADLTGYQSATVLSRVSAAGVGDHLRQMGPGFSEQVILEVEVLRDGAVGSIRVSEGIDPIFDGASVKAAKQWRFRPTLSPAGEPVASWVRLRFRFSTG